MIIDSHHHFWRYTREDYGWIGDDMRILQRDFFPADLETEIRAAGVDGVVSVQARQSIVETEWLLDLARQHPFIYGVVGWVPLVSPKVGEDLERFAAEPKLKSVRHVLQAEPDENYMLRADFNEGIRRLREFDLAYDVLIFERQLPQTIAFVDHHPGQRFIVDHVAKPRIKERVLEPWRTHLLELGRRENVYCKVSGMATEADWATWGQGDLRPYLETVLEAFGPKRLLFGTDWPVCLVASSYQRWVANARTFIASCSADEQERFWSGTAREVYRC